MPSYTAIGPALSSVVRTQLDRLEAQGYRALPCWVSAEVPHATSDADRIAPACAVARRALLAYTPEEGGAIRKLYVLGDGPLGHDDLRHGDPDPYLAPHLPDGVQPEDVPADAVVALSPSRKAWTERTAETVHTLVYHALASVHREAVGEASRRLGLDLDPRTGYPEGYTPPDVPGRKKGHSADDYRRALEEAGSVRGAAARLGVSRQTVLEMIRLHGIER